MAVKGVILAAGRGIRMGGTDHKALVPVGEHESLLRYLLASLRGAGVDDLLVVTGHKPHEIEEFVSGEWTGGATFVRNARYASWGNFHSVRIAIDQAPGFDLLVLNCDIVVVPDVLRRALATPGDLVLAVEQRYRLDEEDMRVELKGNHVTYIGKDLALSRSQGEFCGVSVIRYEASLAYADVATEVEWGGSPRRSPEVNGETSIYYEDVYGRLLDRVDVRAGSVREGEYAEVDAPEDLGAAARVLSRHKDAWRLEQPAGDSA